MERGSLAVPVGFRFLPKDEELLVDFLQKKVKGEPLPHDWVVECDIYGDKEPWMIFDKTLKQLFFVFTKLKKKSKSRMQRIVGSGTWKIEHTEAIHDSENKLIGFKKSFVFEYKKNKAKVVGNGHWIMHEFSLRDYSHLEDFDEYVICRIRNKDTDNMKYPVRSFQHDSQQVQNHEIQILNARNMNPEASSTTLSQFHACYQTPACDELDPIETSLMGNGQFVSGGEMPLDLHKHDSQQVQNHEIQILNARKMNPEASLSTLSQFVSGGEMPEYQAPTTSEPLFPVYELALATSEPLFPVYELAPATSEPQFSVYELAPATSKPQFSVYELENQGFFNVVFDSNDFYV
ncbi:NAC domain-containing protein 19-like [Corylus avellana]|uniref:NAC domain-containing protein 19-like n=1 Tax=Corylus avellana TaxID=13451 RepID=UPI00286B5E61|nr:NAC domain-containing protein 19-like [Corylus avellana]